MCRVKYIKTMIYPNSFVIYSQFCTTHVETLCVDSAPYFPYSLGGQYAIRSRPFLKNIIYNISHSISKYDIYISIVNIICI